MWRPLFGTELLDSYSVRSQTPSIVPVTIAYKDCLNCLCMGKLSLLSQSYVVPFYSKRALQMYLHRQKPLLVYTGVVQQSDNMLRAGSKRSVKAYLTHKGLSTDAVRSGSDIRLNFLIQDGQQNRPAPHSGGATRWETQQQDLYP